MSRHPYADQPPTMVLGVAFEGVHGNPPALWQVMTPEFRKAEARFRQGGELEIVASKLFGWGWRSLTRDRVAFVEAGPVAPGVETVRVVNTETGADLSIVTVRDTDDIGWLIDGAERDRGR